MGRNPPLTRAGHGLPRNFREPKTPLSQPIGKTICPLSRRETPCATIATPPSGRGVGDVACVSLTAEPASQMTSRERVHTAIARRVPDRVPVHDMPWYTTVQRWRNEGLPDGIRVSDLFEYEIEEIWADLSPRLPVRTLSEDAYYVTTTTSTGGIRRNRKDYSNTGEDIESPVKTKQDWLRIRSRLTPDRTRIDWDWAKTKDEAARARGRYVVFQAGCGYDVLKLYVRNEQLLALLVEDRAWVRDMAATISRLTCETLAIMQEEGLDFDGLWVWHDMGYKHRLFFSPHTYREVFAPSDSERNEWCHERGIQTIIHSDGCVKHLIPEFIENGFDCLHPLEVKAGMDLVELKRSCESVEEVAL